MKRRSILLACIFFAGAAVPAIAGDAHRGLTDYAWVSWTTSDGLFPGPFRAIAQDEDGYLWLGVSGDLVRFDGVRFAEAETLGHGTWVNKGVITVLAASRDGSMWIGRSNGGVSRMRNGRFTDYFEGDGLPNSPVTAIVEDARNTVWVGTRSGLRQFVNDRWETPGLPQTLTTDAVSSLFVDREQNLWVDNSSGIFVRHPNGDSFEPVHANTGSIQSFAQDKQGLIWVTDQISGLKRLDRTAAATTAAPTSMRANGVRLLADRSANLWVATRGQGVFRVIPDEPTTALQHLGKDDGLASDVVLALFEDRESNIWVGTENSLVRISSSRGISTETTGGSSAHQTTATSDGSVWIGTPQGLYRQRAADQRHYTEKDGLPSNAITGLAYNPGSDLWVATERGLARFSDERFQSVQLPSGLRANNVTSLTLDHQHALWFCDSEQGLFQLHADGHLDSYRTALDLGRRRCPSAYTDRDGRVWIGFSDGTIAVFHDGSVDRYSHRDGLTGGIVTSLYHDQHGTMWVGTNKGLSRFDDGRFTSFTRDNGLPAKAIAGILDDDLGHMWLSMITGIIRVDRREFDRATVDRDYNIRYTLFDSSDGLLGPPLYLGFPNATSGSDGRLWFVTTGGVAIVDPRVVRGNALPIPAHVESVTANGRVLEPEANLQLPPRLADLVVDYTALNFRSAIKARFRYKLDGFDKDWIEAGTRRQAIYTNLPPGPYKFRVGASNDGAWDGTVATLDFSIEPTFYQTTWFAAGCILLFAASVGLAWRRHLSRVKRQYSLVFDERTRMAREIHDTLLQSLVGVALQFDVIAQKLEMSPASAREQLWRTRDEVEDYIREARQSIWDLRSPMLQANDLPAALTAACQSVAAIRDVRCEVSVHGNPKRYPVKIEEQLLRIAQEAVTNAVRHANPGQISVNLWYGDDSVRLRVTDDGRGFDPDRSSEDDKGHWGLADMRERATQIGAKFALLTRPGQGTQIETLVPYRAKG